MKFLKIKVFILLIASFSESFAEAPLSSEIFGQTILSSILDQYGFSKSQQISLLKIFKKADVSVPEEAFQEVAAEDANSARVLWTMLDIIQETQAKFWARSGGKERWEAQKLKWIHPADPEMLKDLKTLGFAEDVKPTSKDMGAICILGSTGPSMKRRMEYAKELQKTHRSSHMILLAGERQLTLNVDGSESDLMHLAQTKGLNSWTDLTEGDLIQALFQEVFKDQSYTLIYGLKGNLPRATTESTILELLAWLKENQDIKRITFISSQPTVAYQGAIISSILESRGCTVPHEIVGPGVIDPAKKIQSLVEGIGSYLWAAAPQILKSKGLYSPNVKIQENFEKLYAKNPALLAIIKSVFDTAGS